MIFFSNIMLRIPFQRVTLFMEPLSTGFNVILQNFWIFEIFSIEAKVYIAWVFFFFFWGGNCYCSSTLGGKSVINSTRNRSAHQDANLFKYILTLLTFGLNAVSLCPSLHYHWPQLICVLLNAGTVVTLPVDSTCKIRKRIET